MSQWHLSWYCSSLRMSKWSLWNVYQADQILPSKWKCLHGKQVQQNAGVRFSEKEVVIFLKFIGPVTPIWVLSLPETVHMVFRERLLAERSIKVLGWQTGAAKCRSTIFRKRGPGFLIFIEQVTRIWVL